jgi:hypothetical protein
MINDAMNARRLAFKNDGMGLSRKSERASIDDAKSVDVFDECAMAMPDEHRAGTRCKLLRPSSRKRRETRPIDEYRHDAMWANGHVGDRRDVCAGAHVAPLSE